MEVRVSEVLDRAAGLAAREDGWCQHRFGPMDDGRAYRGLPNPNANCLAGCLGRAAHLCGLTRTGLEFDQAHKALRSVIKMNSIATWNDEEGRTQAEVVAALRKAADLARAQEKPTVAEPKISVVKEKVRELELA